MIKSTNGFILCGFGVNDVIVYENFFTFSDLEAFPLAISPNSKIYQYLEYVYCQPHLTFAIWANKMLLIFNSTGSARWHHATTWRHLLLYQHDVYFAVRYASALQTYRFVRQPFNINSIDQRYISMTTTFITCCFISAKQLPRLYRI